jgi:hypothetical protein
MFGNIKDTFGILHVLEAVVVSPLVIIPISLWLLLQSQIKKLGGGRKAVNVSTVMLSIFILFFGIIAIYVLFRLING